MNRRTNSHFKRGSGCYTCQGCGKRTRNVGDDSESVGLCSLCYAQASCGNSLSDNGWQGPEDAWKIFESCKTPAECERLLAEKLAEMGTQL